MQEIYKKSIHPYKSHFEEQKEVCSRRKYALMIMEGEALLYINLLNYVLFPIPEIFIPDYASMAIEKGSPYREVIKIT